MIKEIRVNNYLVYNTKATFSLEADMRTKKLSDNVYHSESGFNINKVAGLFGANNSGKTCLVRAINSLKNIMLNKPAEVPTNLFSKSNICELGISFLYDERIYNYDVKFDHTTINGVRNGFIYENLYETKLDQYGNKKESIIFSKDASMGKYYFSENKEINALLGEISNSAPLLYTVNPTKYPIIEELRKMFTEVGNSIVVIDMNNIPIDYTIYNLKNNSKYSKLISEFVKLADVSIEDFKYSKKPIVSEGGVNKPQEKILERVSLDDMYRLISVYNGKEVPSINYDSKGTKQVEALASFVVDALLSEKTLVVDEIENGLHNSITKAIISMFVSLTNKKGQLIFTSQDEMLLDTSRLLRKDEIYLLNKSKKEVNLYSLNEFTANGDGIREETNIIDRYNKGALGAIPRPDFTGLMLEIEGEIKRCQN
ncbi:MAG: ATP-binding protein [Coprobacillus sp.]|nr:ATP-binding protein [Coprobacillus sp.]